jgi:hypothetical protein
MSVQAYIGRPRALTDQVANKICADVAAGAPYNAAAGKAGVTYDTMRDWFRRGSADEMEGLDTRYSRFAHALTRAQDECEARLAQTLAAGGEGKYKDWRAQAFILERHPRYRERWGPPKNEAPQGLTLALSGEQLSMLTEALRIATARDVTPEQE